jgi:hypothetical protein
VLHHSRFAVEKTATSVSILANVIEVHRPLEWWLFVFRLQQRLMRVTCMLPKFVCEFVVNAMYTACTGAY